VFPIEEISREPSGRGAFYLERGLGGELGKRICKGGEA